MFENLDKMPVTGEDGKAVYYLERTPSAADPIVTVTAADGRKLGDIAQRGTKGLVSFAVIEDGAEVAAVERKSKISINPNFIVKGLDWDVAGSAFSTKSKVTKAGKTIASLKVALVASELDVTDTADPVAVFAIVLAIHNLLNRASDVGSTATLIGVAAFPD